MKICLCQDIPKVGKKREILEVSEGFGRYLIHQKQALPANGEVIKKMEAEKRRDQEKNEKDLQKMQELAAFVDGGEVEIHSNQKSTGTFYAAIQEKQIAKAIKDQLGASIKPEQVKIKKPIKEYGEYTVSLIFKHGIEAEVRVIVS